MNAHAKRPRGELGPCPRCGLYSGQRLAIEGNPDLFLVACDACGWRTRKFTDINHATRAWNEGRQ